MTTVVNNPAPGGGDEKGSGFLIGVVLLIIFGAVILYFAIPAIQNAGPIQVNVPAPQINVPAPQTTPSN